MVTEPGQFSNTKNTVAGGRTKAELLAIRKAMMKPSGLSKRGTEQSLGTESD